MEDKIQVVALQGIPMYQHASEIHEMISVVMNVNFHLVS